MFLLDTFEHTAVYIGDDWFYRISRAYVQMHQSVNTNIGFYGKDFPAFIAEQFPEDLEVSELALMDWKLRRAFDGQDSDVMTAVDLQSQIEQFGGVNLVSCTYVKYHQAAFQYAGDLECDQ